MTRRGLLIFAAALAAHLPAARGQTFAFTVSMPAPANHMFHVILHAEGLKGELQDFQMPVWSPGYYGVQDYARNVTNFRARDGAGRELPWERVTKNTWRVAAANAPAVVLSYDVFGATVFAASNYLGEDRAYLSPPGTFVHVASMTGRPVTVAIELPARWKQISTGLEPVKGKPNTFSASDFDVLYDAPLLMGNQEALEFETGGAPHYVALENVPESVDRKRIVADLKKMVTAATRMMGDVPYRHYTFLLMGRGNGGIEHLNSASIQFNGESLMTQGGYLGWLSYVCHEYFHNFNVKRIRPLALGPFNYDVENLTHMLWVSEGLSVYYQDLLLVRAGLMDRDRYLEKMKQSIDTFENASGHHYQSATEASWNTWNTGSGVASDKNTAISYYNNGEMLGAMLDLRIRERSGNRRSLDDVMRGLYRTYYQEKHRGFTDAEFRTECERAAGGSVDDVLEYASTTKDVDYAKYFGYAGLRLTVTAESAPGAYLGLNTHSQEASVGRATPEMQLFVTSVTAGSPAASAGLAEGDQVLEVEGARATPKTIDDLLTARKPGDRLRLRILRHGTAQEVEAVLSANVKRNYRIEEAAEASPAQKAIREDWLRGGH